MQTITKGRIKNKFIGRTISCSNCHGVFQLEGGDKPFFRRTVDRINTFDRYENFTTYRSKTIDVYSIQCPTKGCHEAIEFKVEN